MLLGIKTFLQQINKHIWGSVDSNKPKQSLGNWIFLSLVSPTVIVL